jgi:hypothetical protein
LWLALKMIDDLRQVHVSRVTIVVGESWAYRDRCGMRKISTVDRDSNATHDSSRTIVGGWLIVREAHPMTLNLGLDRVRDHAAAIGGNPLNRVSRFDSNADSQFAGH